MRLGSTIQQAFPRPVVWVIFFVQHFLIELIELVCFGFTVVSLENYNTLVHQSPKAVRF